MAACYSKRKRQDTQVLHPEVAKRLREWLKTKGMLPADALLFPVSAKIPEGVDRRTSKMMRADLKAARKKWIEKATTPKEKAEREKSEFLKYQNDTGLFADFHSNRHTFITNLERAGVSPRTAQSLARHSDIRLTMGVYTHIGLHDQSSAIGLLSAPPEVKLSGNGADDKPPASVDCNGEAQSKKAQQPASAKGKANGSQPPAPADTTGLGQLDAVWGTLPDNIKAGVLALVNAAVKSDNTGATPIG